MKPETELRLAKAKRAVRGIPNILWKLLVRVVAPAVVTAEIAQSTHMELVNALLFWFAFWAIYTHFFNALERKASFQVKNVINCPTLDDEVDFDRATIKNGVTDQAERVSYSFLGMRDGNVFDIPCENRWDAQNIALAMQTHAAPGAFQTIKVCKTRDLETARLELGLGIPAKACAASANN